MLSIRMRRTGSKKRPFYRVVVAEGRDPREGTFLEVLGMYNPRTKPAKVELDRDRVNYWIKQGARPSDSVRTLLARHLTKDRGAFRAEIAAAAAAAASAAETQAPEVQEPVQAPAAEPTAPPADQA